MEPRITTLINKKLVGINLEMSLVDNKTGELWSAFMPRRKEIKNNITNDLYSLQVYESTHFKNFDPSRKFVKWALIEVSSFDHVPNAMEVFNLVGGLYAVFLHKGSSKDNTIFQYIFSNWLPNSGYSLDNRPHFEILGNKYNNDDKQSEEEIWIPIQSKNF